MSVIVWDGKTLAADKQASSGNLIRTQTKIFRHGDLLIGGAGTTTSVEALRNWVLGGCDPEKFPKLPTDAGHTDLWVINRNGVIRKFEDSPFPVSYDDKVFAEGSGRDFAYGAMAMGADAVTAVKVAIRYDKHCGGGIDVLTFDD